MWHLFWSISHSLVFVCSRWGQRGSRICQNASSKSEPQTIEGQTANLTRCARCAAAPDSALAAFSNEPELFLKELKACDGQRGGKQLGAHTHMDVFCIEVDSFVP